MVTLAMLALVVVAKALIRDAMVIGKLVEVLTTIGVRTDVVIDTLSDVMASVAVAMMAGVDLIAVPVVVIAL